MDPLNGLKRGLQLQKEFFESFNKIVVEDCNESAAAEFAEVMRIWVQELAQVKSYKSAVGKSVNIQKIAGLMLIGGDPFSGSRKAFQDLKAKYA